MGPLFRLLLGGTSSGVFLFLPREWNGEEAWSECEWGMWGLKQGHVQLLELPTR